MNVTPKEPSASGAWRSEQTAWNLIEASADKRGGGGGGGRGWEETLLETDGASKANRSTS
jgi:hypothetical protein